MTCKDKADSTSVFKPKFDDNGLIPCITISDHDGSVLMMAYMNADSLKKSLETGEMHYWSRSRGELWHKGATSGDIQKITDIRIDCDQDCLLARVQVSDDIATEKACHTGRRSCFYRTLHSDGDSVSLIFDDQ